MSASVRLSLFYAAYFLGAGVQLPFWPVWLAGRGLGAAEIGALVGLAQWVRVAASPVLGLAADRMHDRRRFMLVLAAAALGGYLLCVPARGFLALLLPALIVTSAFATLLALADAAALAEAAGGTMDYGRVRLWGTIAFIVATLAGGRVLAGRASGLVLYLLIAAAALTLASASVLPPLSKPARRAHARDALALLSLRNVAFLAAATLIQSSHAVYYAFGTLYWQRLGLGDGSIAWLWAEGAIAEVLLFYAGAHAIRRFGPAALLMLSGAGGAVRWTLTAALTSLPALSLVQPLHALTFAAAHLAAMHYISGAVPQSHAGAAQTVYATATGGLGLGLAAAVAGALYGAWGGATYLVMAAMAGAGGVLAFALAQGQRR